MAELAGVSMRTVSNVVNDYPHVSAQMRERVERAILELGYRPNIAARNLARGRTGVVALVVPRLEMPYFASLTQQMLEVAETEGVTLVVQQTHDSHALELTALEGKFGQPIDGIILSPTTLSDEDVLIRRSQIPLVLLGDRTWPQTVHSVAIDQLEASCTAVAHLLELGRRHVAIVGMGFSPPASGRWEGWKLAHQAAGLAVDPALQIETDGVSGKHGVSAGLHLATMRPRPDGVFCVTDWLALGVISGLQRAGLRVPEDVAVVGYDDIPYGRSSHPTLTTISPDRSQIAALALHSVLLQADGGEAPTAHQADWHLIARESSGAEITPR